jgi:hypothetical protein
LVPDQTQSIPADAAHFSSQYLLLISKKKFDKIEKQGRQLSQNAMG